ncbi:hypothetical protein K0M31_003575, partial [Melipona bicolor]
MRYACIRETGRETALVVFVQQCVYVHISNSTGDSMLECSTTCGGHSIPTKSISIVTGYIGSQP